MPLHTVILYITFFLQFMLRTEVLKLYKQMLRLVRKIPDQSQRQQLQNFIRQDFELNKNLEDEVIFYFTYKQAHNLDTYDYEVDAISQ